MATVWMIVLVLILFVLAFLVKEVRSEWKTGHKR